MQILWKNVKGKNQSEMQKWKNRSEMQNWKIGAGEKKK